jgi:Tfp pilus assembly protein PilV
MKTKPVPTKKSFRAAGFSLIEVLVFVSVFSVALVSLIASVSYSSLLLNDARSRVIATRASEELSEWLKFQREFKGFNFLKSKIPGSIATYCFNQNVDTWPDTPVECSGYSFLDFYKRELELSYPDSPSTTKIQAIVTTRWSLINREKKAEIVINFNDYEF